MTESGRSNALVYRAERVLFRRLVARKDGGWGQGCEGATEFEPEGGVIFYESSDSQCVQCVVLDSLKESHESAEPLGALVMNSHEPDLLHDLVFLDCVVVNNAYSGVTFEGLSAILDSQLTNSLVAQNEANDTTPNISPANILLQNITVRDNGGAGAASYSNADISVVNSEFVDNSGEARRNISGAIDGAGVVLLTTVSTRSGCKGSF
ncbi:MAG: hypothetical protein GY822_11425 [Deltaproteobacteria bacterium]|nr:hypothetical protein [Deltaproteobacteria bacterium]